MSSNRQLFLKHIAQTSDFPMALEIIKAEGNYLFDVNNKSYLDLISGISVSNLGHSNQQIIDAVKKQVETNMHLMVYGEYIVGPQVELANELSNYLPENLESVYFVNSGSEAVEGAMKLAKRYTGRTKIVSFHSSYHGSSHGALSLGGSENMRNAFRPLLPEMIRFNYNDFASIQKIDEQVAAVFVEPVQAEAGIIFPAKGFLEALRKRCDETRTLLVFDEIQTGYGRLGKLFAINYFNVIPDVLVLAKGFGGGMPLGAFISSNSIMKSLRNDPVLGHITTFGGHPVSCAASLAALKILTKTQIMNEVHEKGLLFKKLLNEIENKVEIRGDGLMLAIQLKNFDQVQQVIKKCLHNGLIVDWFLYNDSSIRISAPLTISQEEIVQACSILKKSIDHE